MTVVGTHIIRRPYIEARCTPLRDGGWKVESVRGITEHPHVGDPYLALDRHIAATIGNPLDAEPTAPTARDIFDAMLGVRTGRMTPDEMRAVMRRSREMNGEAEHDRLKAIALSNFDRKA